MYLLQRRISHRTAARQVRAERKPQAPLPTALLASTSTPSLSFRRLLFLLQCLLSFLASRRGGPGSRAPPLSTGTVCRKLATLILEEGPAEHNRPEKAALQESSARPAARILAGADTRSRCASTQTTETCLSLCAHCMELRETLATAAHLVAGALEASQKSKGETPIAKACTDTDKSAAEWLHVFEASVSHIVSAHKCAVDQCVSLASCLQSAEQRLEKGEEALHAAQQELACAVANSEAASQERLTELQARLSQDMQAKETEVAQLKQNRAELERCTTELERCTAELQHKLLQAETTIAEQSRCPD